MLASFALGIRHGIVEIHQASNKALALGMISKIGHVTLFDQAD